MAALSKIKKLLLRFWMWDKAEVDKMNALPPLPDWEDAIILLLMLAFAVIFGIYTMIMKGI